MPQHSGPRAVPLTVAAVIVPIVAAVVVAVVALSGGDDPAEPLALTSDGPEFATLDELVAASDLVVVATVTDISEGRVLTAPDRPESGIKTRLLELDVARTLAGEPVDPLVVEEPAELLDGTPVVVDGMAPLAEGAEAIWFLVAGASAEQPYHAVVNAQGRYDISGATLQAAGTDPLSEQLAALGPDGLAAAVRDR